MKPFDLELAKAGDRIVTRSGCPVRIICFDRKEDRGNYSLVGLVYIGTAYAESLQTFSIDGLVSTRLRSPEPEPYDLFMAPKTKKVWINVYPPRRGSESGVRINAYCYDSKDEAYEAAEYADGRTVVEHEIEI